MYIPLNYMKLNNINSHLIPQNVKYIDNVAFNYWERSLFQRCESVIEFTGIPEEWEGNILEFFYYCLFRFGFLCVWHDDNFGLVFNPCNISGIDFYYNPTTAIIANPAIKDGLRLDIGKDCELIKLTPDYMGIWDIISYYAEKLSMLDSAVNMAIMNSKMSWLIGAKNKGVAETLKRVYDKMQKGEPLVIFDKVPDDPATKSEPFQFIEKDVKSSYIVTDLLHDMSTILHNFDCEVGIPTMNFEKKERMITNEAQSQIIDSMSRSTVWLDTLKETLSKVNKMFDLNIDCRLRYDQEGG